MNSTEREMLAGLQPQDTGKDQQKSRVLTGNCIPVQLLTIGISAMLPDLDGPPTDYSSVSGPGQSPALPLMLSVVGELEQKLAKVHQDYAHPGARRTAVILAIARAGKAP